MSIPKDLNIIIFIGIFILRFYVINMDDMSLFANLSFLFLSTLNLYCIHILYFINLKKKKTIVI